MTLTQYLSKLNTLFITGNAREHSYRGDLQNLIMAILPDILVTNEPARVSCGAPDYVLTRKNIPVGYIEAKDIGVDLGSRLLKEQFERYKAGLSNLIITDYLHFEFYKEGEFVTKISIGKIEGGLIIPQPENFEQFNHLIENFALSVSQSIKSPTRLAKMMAGKAKLMADVIEKSLNNDDKLETRSNLKSQMISFQQMLIHDITNNSFADIYAQTIAYGMFAARYHDPSLENFSRMEAAQLIPKSNPFLRKLFQDIAGYDLDDRLVWIVDELVNIFLASDVSKIMKNFGKSTKQDDPVVHFYETFLGEYNPALRKARGVWYTPQPVVNFIVRAVDDILKEEFDLPQGLADTSKTKVTVKVPTHDKRYASGMRDYEKEVHKVQILDPATGTGTFLAEVVKLIYKKFEGQQGIWNKYVANDLIPRLNGFELLMASYAMAHLKMDMLLTETGYKPTDNQRFRIFLTNSLEEAHPDTGTLFSSWLSDEADQANAIKKDTPVMCVIGNPPYSGISSNNGEWISNLIEDYKYVDGEHFKERKHWLNDDYVKFMRFGQYFIEKNGEGILAFINNHSFIDNPTFKGMRWQLLNAFDKIHIIDLHGNSKKKEISPDGTSDKNVFDIQAGVSINIFCKTGKKGKGELAKVFHTDCWGKREDKYEWLLNNKISSIPFKLIENRSPFYFFNPKNYDSIKEYNKAFKLNDLFIENNVGCVSANDKLNISYSQEKLKLKILDILEMKEDVWRQKYNRKKDARDWTYLTAKKDAAENSMDNFRRISYRPFDIRWTCYTGNSRGLYSSPQPKSMRHITKQNNLGLIVGRQGQVVGNMPWNLIFVTKEITDFNLFYRGGGMLFPLYLYPKKSEQQTTNNEQQTRIPNLNLEIIDILAEGINHAFLPDENLVCDLEAGLDGSFSPMDILDYIYAVLHSPGYREKYKEFLKSDFPRVPYPQDAEDFWKLVTLGGELRRLHLLESPLVEQYITTYPEDGDNIIIRKISKNSPGYGRISETHGKVWINDQQFFDNVPLVAWEFYIGGYQPAQKWLKDRKGRELTYEDILHYQKIIVALTETDRLMKEIDELGVIVEEQLKV